MALKNALRLKYPAAQSSHDVVIVGHHNSTQPSTRMLRLLLNLPKEDRIRVKVEVTDLPVGHAAAHGVGSKGVFTQTVLQPNAIIGEYVGAKSTEAEHRRWEMGSSNRYVATPDRNKYVLTLDERLLEQTSVFVDAAKEGNSMMFINDYRNIKSEANVEYVTVVDRLAASCHVFVVSKVTIPKGAELLGDYGHEYLHKRKLA